MLYIVLPVHNRKPITELFIKNLMLQSEKHFQLLLVDDGSSDGTSDMVLSYLPKTVVIQGKGNWWWGGSLHQGYKWIRKNSKKEDTVLLCNDDISFKPDFIETGLKYLKEYPDSLVHAQTYSAESGKLLEHGIQVDWKRIQFKHTSLNSEINCLPTRGLFLKASDFKKIGGFHPFLIPHYFSDYDFTIRAYRKGFKLMVIPELKLFLNESTTGYHKINSKNFIDCLKKYFSKKNPTQPFYFLFFLLLSAPKKYFFFYFLSILKKIISKVLKRK